MNDTAINWPCRHLTFTDRGELETVHAGLLLLDDEIIMDLVICIIYNRKNKCNSYGLLARGRGHNLYQLNVNYNNTNKKDRWDSGKPRPLTNTFL